MVEFLPVTARYSVVVSCFSPRIESDTIDTFTTQYGVISGMVPLAIEPVGIVAVVIGIILLIFAIRFAVKLIWRLAVLALLVVAALYAAGVLV